MGENILNCTPLAPKQPIAKQKEQSPIVKQKEQTPRNTPQKQNAQDSYYTKFPEPVDELFFGDHIAFRLLEMGRKWTDIRLSGWKEAIVVELDSENNLITLKPPDKLSKRGQSLDLAEGTTSITMEITTLKDIRLISAAQ